MDDDFFAKMCAGICCLGMWSILAGIGGFFAHRRMRAVEDALGARAEPPNESRFLWYAGAAAVWLAAAVLAVVGLWSRKWTRTGRDALFILLAHFTIVTLGAVFLTPDKHADADPEQSAIMLITFACVVAGAGFTVAPVFAFLWARARAVRVSALPSTGAPPGAARYAIYFGSLLAWPIGMVAAALYNEPQNVRVGATALQISLAQIWLIAVAVCVGLPILLRLYI